MQALSVTPSRKRLRSTDWSQIIFSSVVWVRFPHMLIAAYLTALSAWLRRALGIGCAANYAAEAV